MVGLIDRFAKIAAEVVAARVKEADERADYYKRQSDTWRGIAAAMGYEPKAHLKVRPKDGWLIDRVAKYRAQVVAEANPVAAPLDDRTGRDEGSQSRSAPTPLVDRLVDGLNDAAAGRYTVRKVERPADCPDCGVPPLAMHKADCPRIAPAPTKEGSES